MEFENSTQAIYLQIADYVFEKILLNQWPPESKVPSVRELAIRMEVNPNTVARTYEFLKNLDVITDKRGVGYFVTPDGHKKAISYRKKEFLDKELPVLLRNMHMLDIGPEELTDLFKEFKKQNKY